MISRGYFCVSNLKIMGKNWWGGGGHCQAFYLQWIISHEVINKIMSSILNFIWHEGVALCKLSLFSCLFQILTVHAQSFFLSLKSLREMKRTIWLKPRTPGLRCIRHIHVAGKTKEIPSTRDRDTSSTTDKQTGGGGGRDNPPTSGQARGPREARRQRRHKSS